MTHLRYVSSDKDWDIDLKVEGFTEEQVDYWKTVLQRETMLFLLLFPDKKGTCSEEHED